MLHSKTTIAVPPGATIREQLENREMPQKEFALRMGMSEKHISHLINGKVELTSDVALRLESVLGLLPYAKLVAFGWVPATRKANEKMTKVIMRLQHGRKKQE